MTKLQIKHYRDSLKDTFQKSSQKSWIFSIISILFGFLFGFIIMVCVNPSQSLQGFSTLITGGFNRSFLYSVGNILFNCTPYIGVGLAVAIASKAGVFNIGGSGQYTVGGCMALIVANLINDKIPSPAGFIICLAVGMLSGAIYALIPALLKNHFNVNIVVSAIMLNYIAAYGTAILCKNELWFDSINNRIYNSTDKISNCMIPTAGLNEIFSFTTSAGKVVPSRLDISIIIAIAICILLFFLFKKTSFGLKITTSGQNETAAKYSGINNHRQLCYAMMISGAMAGMGAVFSLLSQRPSNFQPSATVNSIGFTGISVALIANNNPIACIFSSLLISYIETSGGGLTAVGFNANIIGIITSVIIYSSATAFLLSKFVYGIKVKRESKKKYHLLTDHLISENQNIKEEKIHG